MGFRDDLEAQLRRSEALERELADERRRTEALEARVAELQRERDRPGDLRQPEEQTPPLAARGLPASRLRRVFAVCSVCLGSLTAVLSVAAREPGGTGIPAYDLAEQIVYVPMSLLLASLGLAYFKWPAKARLGFLVWGALGIAVEIVDFIAETLLFGTAAPWIDPIIWFAFPVLVVVVFLKRESSLAGSAGLDDEARPV